MRCTLQKGALVHDAARPCLTHEDLDALITAAMASGGAILGSRVRDTMKRTDAAGNILATVDREQLWHALTPQMFLVRPSSGRWRRAGARRRHHR